ncbi:MAG: hypothetical protein WCE93_11000, partial [Nitrososphaeraceae archaeon]
MYIAWYDTGVNYNGNANLIFRRSIDGGNTFQNPISLSSIVYLVSYHLCLSALQLWVIMYTYCGKT